MGTSVRPSNWLAQNELFEDHYLGDDDDQDFDDYY
jgi:hypothetical protein